MIFLKKLQPINRRESKKGNRQSLAPRMPIKGLDSAYYSVDDLSYAMTLPQSKNIAITGIYESGKSSIINTFLSTENATQNEIIILKNNQSIYQLYFNGAQKHL